MKFSNFQIYKFFWNITFPNYSIIWTMNAPISTGNQNLDLLYTWFFFQSTAEKGCFIQHMSKHNLLTFDLHPSLESSATKNEKKHPKWWIYWRKPTITMDKSTFNDNQQSKIHEFIGKINNLLVKKWEHDWENQWTKPWGKNNNNQQSPFLFSIFCKSTIILGKKNIGKIKRFFQSMQIHERKIYWICKKIWENTWNKIWKTTPMNCKKKRNKIHLDGSAAPLPAVALLARLQGQAWRTVAPGMTLMPWIL